MILFSSEIFVVLMLWLRHLLVTLLTAIVLKPGVFNQSPNVVCVKTRQKLVRQIKLRIQALINILIFTDRCSF